MKNWLQKLSKFSIFFISPDVKRGIGLDDLLPDYHIICADFDEIIPQLRKNNAKILCLEEMGLNHEIKRNTGSLLTSPAVQEYIEKHAKSVPYIAFFKPSLKIDAFIAEKRYRNLGNGYNLNEIFENKIKIVNFLKNGFSEYLLPYKIGRLHHLEFGDLVKKLNLPFVIQFGFGWAGKTTFFISSEESFNILKIKFPQTIVRVNPQIDGPTFLNNCCIYKREVYISPPALQINGIKKLCLKEYVTCGRQWSGGILDRNLVDEINEISVKIGIKMESLGYRGFFGIDFLQNKKSGQIFISEINARLTASSAFYTLLERGAGQIPLLAYHYASFTGTDLPQAKGRRTPILGSQVIIRNKKTYSGIKITDFGTYEIRNQGIKFVNSEYLPEKLSDKQFIYHREKNVKSDSEIARIETKMNALSSPGILSPWLTNLISGLT